MLWFKKTDKAVWASLVLARPVSHKEQIPTEKLSAATDCLLTQWREIIMESVSIIERTNNADTRQRRIDLCRRHLKRMNELKPFADRRQLALIRECERVCGGLL